MKTVASVLAENLKEMGVTRLSSQMYPRKLIHFDYDPTFIGKTLNSSEKVKKESKFTKEAFITERKTMNGQSDPS